VGAGDPKVAACLNSLAKWLTIQVRVADWISVVIGVLYGTSIVRYMSGAYHFSACPTTNMNDLPMPGHTCLFQCKYEEAETLFQRAVAILEAQLGPDHADVAKVCVNLADLYRKQVRNMCHCMRGRQFGGETRSSNCRIASMLHPYPWEPNYREQGRNNEAEHLSDRAAAGLSAKAMRGSKSAFPSEGGVLQGGYLYKLICRSVLSTSLVQAG